MSNKLQIKLILLFILSTYCNNTNADTSNNTASNIDFQNQKSISDNLMNEIQLLSTANLSAAISITNKDLVENKSTSAINDLEIIKISLLQQNNQEDETMKAIESMLSRKSNLSYKQKQHLYYMLGQMHQNKGNHQIALNYYKESLKCANLEINILTKKQLDENLLLTLSAKKNILLTTLFLLILGVIYYQYIKIKKEHLSLDTQNATVAEQIKKLEESNQALQQFAYSAAHDLKEPLRSISGFVGLIKRRYMADMGKEANDYMDYVTRGVDRMNNLLTDLLNYSTIIAEEKSYDNIAISEIINDVKENLNQVILDKNATLIFNTNMPEIQMNRLHLTQLIQNLVSNSLKFIDNNKSPLIEIDCITESDRTCISIKDNGIGIKEEYAKKIFTLFHQLHKDKYEGTGIGLAICKNIVDKYNGNIWFESKEQVGTTFFICIPKNAIFNNIAA